MSGAVTRRASRLAREGFAHDVEADVAVRQTRQYVRDNKSPTDQTSSKRQLGLRFRTLVLFYAKSVTVPGKGRIRSKNGLMPSKMTILYRAIQARRTTPAAPDRAVSARLDLWG
jgi:hypothetical protein